LPSSTKASPALHDFLTQAAPAIPIGRLRKPELSRHAKAATADRDDASSKHTRQVDPDRQRSIDIAK